MSHDAMLLCCYYAAASGPTSFITLHHRPHRCCARAAAVAPTADVYVKQVACVGPLAEDYCPALLPYLKLFVVYKYYEDT